MILEKDTPNQANVEATLFRLMKFAFNEIISRFSVSGNWAIARSIRHEERFHSSMCCRRATAGNVAAREFKDCVGAVMQYLTMIWLHDVLQILFNRRLTHGSAG
jgi:hypothetical protein